MGLFDCAGISSWRLFDGVGESTRRLGLRRYLGFVKITRVKESTRHVGSPVFAATLAFC
jgi:hypothetical protein